MMAQENVLGPVDPDDKPEVVKLRDDIYQFVQDYAKTPKSGSSEEKELLKRRTVLRHRAEKLELNFGLERIRANARYLGSKLQPKRTEAV